MFFFLLNLPMCIESQIVKKLKRRTFDYDNANLASQAPRGFSLPDSIEKFCDSTYFFLLLHAFSNLCNSMHLRLHWDSMPLEKSLVRDRFWHASNDIYAYFIVNSQALTSFKKYIYIYISRIFSNSLHLRLHCDSMSFFETPCDSTHFFATPSKERSPSSSAE